MVHLVPVRAWGCRDALGEIRERWGSARCRINIAVDDASAGESQGDGHQSGSWRVNVHNDDGDESVSILSFAAGQVCVVHDISPAGPPFTGTWRSGRHGSFRATVLTGFPGDGPGSPGTVIELKLFGKARHGRLSGSFTFQVTDPAGNEVATGSGTFDGERIQA
jgi:hypothetical protein